MGSGREGGWGGTLDGAGGGLAAAGEVLGMAARGTEEEEAEGGSAAGCMV